jgi:hypothetical protein
MDAVIVAMHLAAGREYGREATCGTKVKYGSEETAIFVAANMTIKFNRSMEGYPCFWCDDWHIGREMTPEECEQFMGL